MKLQQVLFFSLLVFCLGKPAKRSTESGDSGTSDGGGNVTTTGQETAKVLNACPGDLACVAKELCVKKMNFDCPEAQLCCNQTVAASDRKKRSIPHRNFIPHSDKHRRPGHRGRPKSRPHGGPHGKPKDRAHARPHSKGRKPHHKRPKLKPIHKYMDYYDSNYEKIFGPAISKHAKDIYKNYRPSKECGVRHDSPKQLARVSSGYLHERGFTSFGEFPWHVALLVKERVFRRLHHRRPREDVRYKCGGTVISEKYIITAAHCVFGERLNRLKVHLGEWNLDGSTGELFPAIERGIAKVHIHTEFNPSTYMHDIAILRMNKPVDFTKTPHINPVCLSPAEFGHKKCYVVGWGDDVYKPNFGSNILRAASVVFESDIDVCRAKFFTSFNTGILDPSFNLDEDYQKCVLGQYGVGACVGDGGGAVVCPLTNEEKSVDCDDYKCADQHFFMAGIISFGSPNCGEDESVTVITNIEENLNWIKAITTAKDAH